MESYIKNKGFCVWLTGLSAAGKSTTANAISQFLTKQGINFDILDGDQIRTNLSKGLGFSKEDRYINIRRVSWVAAKIVKNNGIAIVACISPYLDMREEARELIEQYGRFIEVYCNAPLSVCEQRDPKGLYKKARKGELLNFTGISDPYQPPENPEISLDTSSNSVDDNLRIILNYLNQHKLIIKNKRRALYIGRWQPLHNGHDYIIRQKLNEGIPVAIAVRDTPVSESNPYSAKDRLALIEEAYKNDDVIAFVVPDIESVNIGRKVGYEVNFYEVPEDIEGISATEIRRLINANDVSWKSKVPQRCITIIEQLSAKKI